ncbi:ParB/RepB/Spo0J family partition protein [Luteibaculum oceani]|uniref:ParB/RepB/Spo0J family partition protein n=1 Tax=Luteibaculum oceani TaxID=1294296 RepID=A0A5C6UVS5_9FLAO|nr:ParB/RepB/Spo0J family partition protein [Luteibaculum oceani]TXC77069.1 ParB/RepB/Spo0J family partition protein [Luteibaculum oceani]
MAKKQALGRGLGALLKNEETDITSKYSKQKDPSTVGSVALISLSSIETNPFQPRTTFEEEALKELADSIKQLGVIQPITVRKLGYDKFQLISGERRFRASKMAGLEEIPAYVRIANDQSMLEMAIVENVQRQDLDAIEVALSYQRLIDECKLTQEELGERVGKNRTTVTNYLRLLKLPEEVQAAIMLRKISMGHARALLGTTDKELQVAILEEILSEGLSVRAVEELVRNQNIAEKEGKKVSPSSKKSKGEQREPTEIEQSVAQTFTEKFGFTSSLKCGPKGKGKLEINYKNPEQLKKLLELLS